MCLNLFIFILLDKLLWISSITWIAMDKVNRNKINKKFESSFQCSILKVYHSMIQFSSIVVRKMSFGELFMAILYSDSESKIK